MSRAGRAELSRPGATICVGQRAAVRSLGSSSVVDVHASVDRGVPDPDARIVEAGRGLAVRLRRRSRCRAVRRRRASPASSMVRGPRGADQHACGSSRGRPVERHVVQLHVAAVDGDGLAPSSSRVTAATCSRSSVTRRLRRGRRRWPHPVQHAVPECNREHVLATAGPGVAMLHRRQSRVRAGGTGSSADAATCISARDQVAAAARSALVRPALEEQSSQSHSSSTPRRGRHCSTDRCGRSSRRGLAGRQARCRASWPCTEALMSTRHAAGQVVCPGWDSNPHWTVFETASSAVGIPGLSSAKVPDTTARDSSPGLLIKSTRVTDLSRVRTEASPWRSLASVVTPSTSVAVAKPVGASTERARLRNARAVRSVRVAARSTVGRPTRLTRAGAYAPEHRGGWAIGRVTGATDVAASLSAVTEAASPAARRHRRGRGADPAWTSRRCSAEEGYDVVGQAGDGEQGRRARRGAPARPGHPRREDAAARRHRRRRADRRAADRAGRHPHRLLPARPGRAGPRRGRDGLPGQAVHARPTWCRRSRWR